MSNKKKNSSRGVLTLDFIFSFLVMYGLSSVFALMAMTLMMSSIAQYITFAANRAHISGHIDENRQREMGVRKFEQLVGQLAPFFGTNTQSWFQVQINEPDPPQPFGNQANQWKYGFTVDYTANIMKNASFPIIGGPGDGDGGANFGTARLKAYMYREPSTDECIQFNRQRWEKILSRFTNLGGYISGSDAYGSSPDNGC